MAEAYGAVKGRSSGRSAAGLLKFIASDFGTVIDRHIKDARLKAILCQLWIYMGLPPSKLRAIDFIYPFFDYLSGGGYYLEKGSYEIVRNLESRIRDNGGVFMLGCRARSVSRSGQGPYRIDLDSGSVYCDTLVSNIDAAGTLRMFGEDAFCPESAERIGSITPSISAFEIFLSIGADLGGRYPDDYEIFINDGYDPEAQYRSCLENDARLSPFVITLNSNLNPFSAPRGRSAVSIIMLSGYGGWKRLSRRDYLDRKDEMAGILIERASKVIPEIGSAVRHVTVSTPVTFERYTGNSCGAIYGYSGVFARRPGIRLNDLPGRGDLYFASAWAGQGSGVAKVLGAADEVYRKVSEKSIERSLA
jgi:phytoene dehydrogenase-like protein